MVYNTISAKNVVAKILRDLDIQEDNTRFSDIMEWIGEGLMKIGAIKTHNVKVAGKEDQPLIAFDNYQAKLPTDLVKLLGAAYSQTATGPFTALRYGTGSYDGRGEEHEASSSTYVAAESDIIALTMQLYDLDYESALELLNSDPTVRTKMNMLLIDENQPSIQQQTNTTFDYTFVINSSYIKLNIKEGYLMLAYSVYSMDEDGYPLIPDDTSFTEALYWYVVMKYWYPAWVQGTIRDRVYYDAKNSWNFYRKQAYAHAMLPDVSQLESMKNQVLKLYPEIDSFDNFFSTLGEQQIIYNH